jgi:hypothetical protein
MHLLKELLPWAANARFSSPIRRDGKPASLYGELEAKVDAGGESRKRRFMAVAPLNVATRLTVEMDQPISDCSGINAKVLDQENQWHVEAWAEMSRVKATVDRPAILKAVEEMEDAMSSEISLLYNLIRQYYLLCIDSEVINPDDDYYNDGHVAATYRSVFGIGEDEDEVDDQWGLYVLENPDVTTSPDAPYIGWPRMTKSQADVVVAGLSELTGRDGVALAAKSPRLAEQIRVGASPHDDIMKAWSKKNCVADVIFKLVTHGRLYNHFDNALHMVAQTACHFKAPVAEAVQLCGSTHVIQLPVFRTFRFQLRGLLDDEAGGVRPSAVATYKCWIESRNSFWVYAATLRAAAEFRGVISHGTDFDSTDSIVREAHLKGINGNVGWWLSYAASALGKKIWAQPNIPAGATLAAMDEPVGFRVVGNLDGYYVHQDVGEGENRRVRIEVSNDERRTALHPHLLFALGVLPESKVGAVPRSADIEVKVSRKRGRSNMVRGKHIGAYLTMSRAFGYDAQVHVPGGPILNSWADNDSRMAWAAGEIMDTADSWYEVSGVEWRGESIHKRVIDPSLAGKYKYELNIPVVGMLYDYGKPINIGEHLPSTTVSTAQTPVVPVKAEQDIQLEPVVIEAGLEDFQAVPAPIGQIAPGTALDPPQAEDPDPPEEGEPLLPS